MTSTDNQILMNLYAGVPVSQELWTKAEHARREVQQKMDNLNEQMDTYEQIKAQQAIIADAKRNKTKGVIRNAQKRVKDLKERIKALVYHSQTLNNGGVY